MSRVQYLFVYMYISIGNQVWGQSFLFSKKMPTKPLEQICEWTRINWTQIENSVLFSATLIKILDTVRRQIKRLRLLCDHKEWVTMDVYVLCGWLAVKHAKVKQKTGNSLDTWRLKMPPKHSYKVADQQAQLSSSKMNTNCKQKSNTFKLSPRKGFWFCAVYH